MTTRLTGTDIANIAFGFSKVHGPNLAVKTPDGDREIIHRTPEEILAEVRTITPAGERVVVSSFNSAMKHLGDLGIDNPSLNAVKTAYKQAALQAARTIFNAAEKSADARLQITEDADLPLGLEARIVAQGTGGKPVTHSLNDKAVADAAYRILVERLDSRQFQGQHFALFETLEHKHEPEPAAC